MPAQLLLILNINGCASVVPINFFTVSVPPLPVSDQPLPATIVCQLGAAAVPIFTIRRFLAESYTSRPFAGLTMDVMDAVPILGISNPLLLLVISSCADALGARVPRPTLWA